MLLENHLHMSLSENGNVLSIATGCPKCSKNLHRGVVQHAQSKLTMRFAL